MMHIITRKRINDFIEKYPDSQSSLETWYAIVKKNEYASFAEVKKHFSDADYVEGFVVFNIGGNKYGLIAVIHFNRKKVYIREILTHKEYDRNRWRR